MAKINPVKEITEHTDAEIIEYLASKMSAVQMLYRRASEANTPEKLYTVNDTIELVSSVLAELNKRNKEHIVQ